MKIYLAGPLFTMGERKFNVALAWYLRDHGYRVWVPQENEPREQLTGAAFEKAVFDLDVQGIDQADVIVANMDGPDVDSGTAWEVGYAYKSGKLVILFRTDFRAAGEVTEGHPYNIMLSQSAFAHIAAPCLRDKPEDLGAAIVEALKQLETFRCDCVRAAEVISNPPQHTKVE